MNDYYNATNLIARQSLARSADENADRLAVKAAFDLLPPLANLNEGKLTYAVAGGSANAYTVNLPRTLGSYADGLKVRFKVPVTNTGPSTLNVDGLGARTIKRIDGTDVDAGDLTAGDIAEVILTGANFVLATPSRTHMEGVATTLAGSPTYTGNPTFSGNPVFSGNPSFTGTPSFVNASYSGSVTYSGSATFSGNPSFTGNPDFSGSPTFTGTPTFSAATTFNALATFSAGVQLSATTSISTGGVLSVGTNLFRADDIQGRVAIGTATPTAPFHVTVNTTFDGNVTGNGTWTLNGGMVVATDLDVSASTGERAVKIGTSRSADGGSGVNLISDTTTTDWNSRFHRAAGVNGATAVEAKGTGGIDVQTLGAAEIRMSTNSTQAMVIDGSQQVGIGTATPAAKLDVGGSTNISGDVIIDGGTGARVLELGKNRTVDGLSGLYVTTGTTGTYQAKFETTSGPNGITSIVSYGTGGMWVGTNDAAGLNFQTGGLTHVTLDSGGNLGIGTTTPTDAVDIAKNVTVTNQSYLFGWRCKPFLNSPGTDLDTYTTGDGWRAVSWTSAPPAPIENTPVYLRVTDWNGNGAYSEQELRYRGKGQSHDTWWRRRTAGTFSPWYAHEGNVYEDPVSLTGNFLDYTFGPEPVERFWITITGATIAASSGGVALLFFDNGTLATTGYDATTTYGATSLTFSDKVYPGSTTSTDLRNITLEVFRESRKSNTLHIHGRFQRPLSGVIYGTFNITTILTGFRISAIASNGAQSSFTGGTYSLKWGG